MAENDTLSEAQVWDDSALQDVWNASVQEYQKYHSINARGEDVVEVLKAAAEAEAAEAKAEMGTIVLNGNGMVEEGSAAVNGDSQAMQGVDDHLGNAQAEEGKDLQPDPRVATASQASAEHPNGLPVPQAMIAQSNHDDKLKNLMMSWYWAGYYTGFYEGQQQGRMSTTSNGV